MSIFIDMDGVLVDFVGTACNIFGFEEKEVLSRWTPGEWDMYHVLGITRNEFFAELEKHGEDFWANAKHYYWTDDLFDFCESLAPTFILTTPTDDPACSSGKLRWLQKWKGSNFHNYIFTPVKERCARIDRVLIDDKDKNIALFREHQGHGILFPCITNSKHALEYRNIDYVKHELLEWRNKHD